MTPAEIRKLRAALDETDKRMHRAVEAMANMVVAFGNLTAALRPLLKRKGNGQ
jgi:hypothetical protein